MAPGPAILEIYIHELRKDLGVAHLLISVLLAIPLSERSLLCVPTADGGRVPGPPDGVGIRPRPTERADPGE